MPPKDDRPLANAKLLLREWLLALAVMILMVVVLATTNSLSRFNQAIYNEIARLTAPLPPDDVLIVAIDDTSIDALGPWPWPSARHGEAIDAFRRAGAVAIGYCAGFDRDASDALARARAA